MIYCQACLTQNKNNAEVCAKCGARLLVLGGNATWEEPDPIRVSMEDHFLERISQLEETVSTMLEHLSRVADSMENVDRNAFITRAGLSSLVDVLKESNLLREELLYERWESTILEQMEEARYRDRFSQMKSRFLALYRGPQRKRASFQAHVADAEFLIYSDRFSESAEVLSKALKLDPKNYELAYYLAEFYQQQGMNEEAKQNLRMALKANPDHADSLLILALILYGEADEKEAESLLSRCIEVNPTNPVALFSMGSILVSQERFDEAEPLLEKANELEPHAQSYYLLGLVYKAQGRLSDAIDNLSYAVELDPDHEESIFTLGMAYLERGWTRKAKNCFSRALELNPGKLEYQEAQDFQTDREETTSSLDETSREELRIAEALFRAGKAKQALPYYRKLLKKHPNDNLLLSSYAALNHALRRPEETLKCVRKILNDASSDIMRCVAYTLEVEAYRALGRYDEAIASLEEMLDEFPEGNGQAIAICGLAMTKADMGQDLKQAEELAQQALQISPPDWRHKALDALGWVYFKQGRYEEALQILENVLSMHENVNHLYHYGMILLALDLKEEAFRVFEQTVAKRNQQAKVDEFIFAAIHREMDNDLDTNF